jgi:D-alanyl-D-alanine carboxypeptidase
MTEMGDLMVSFIDQVRPVTLPSSIVGLPNGELPNDVLQDVFAADGTKVGRLCAPAARAYQAMVATAAADRVDLRPTSIVDTFRPLTVQTRIFEERYAANGLGGGCKVCEGFGLRCKKSAALASAACPGTSNHGRGIAVDIADVGLGGRLAWLEANAGRFGFAWELVPEEPWHIRYTTGDNLPAAVFAHEAGIEEEDDVKATYVQHTGHAEVFVAGLGITPRHVVLFADAEFVADLTGVRIVSAPDGAGAIEVQDSAGTKRRVQVVDDKGARLFGLPTAG